MKSLFHQPVLFPIIATALRKARQAAVLLLGLALVTVPTQVVFGQFNQQQEQQQREQQEREQQQREQQQREQQAREQQQRDQQQREQQEREQQQREQQAREQQQRDQQQRDQQQREQQERVQQQQHFSDGSPAPSSNTSSAPSTATAHPPATDVRGTTSDIKPLSAERNVNSAPAGNATATKDHGSTLLESDLRRTVCKDGPCQEPAPKPVQLKPVAPDPPRKVCKDGPCQVCPAGKSEGKDGSCATPPAVVKNGNVRGVGTARNAAQQLCAAGQVWNGTQCLSVGAQQCLPGQSRVGTTCQADCTTPTASAQNIIVELRSARLRKDDICLQNPTGMECQEAEAHYNIELNEYRNFLVGVPTECRTALPDPIAI